MIDSLNWEHERVMAERDRLRAENERLREALQALLKIERRRDALYQLGRYAESAAFAEVHKWLLEQREEVKATPKATPKK